MIQNTYKLKITALTPVTVGSGEELSPYADYIATRDSIHIIDKTALQNKVARNDIWMDTYVEALARGMDNNRSDFDLKVFIENTLKEKIDTMSLVKYPFYSSRPQSKLPIKSMLKTPLMEPYLPGSSLKGAIKTAVMYNLLDEINENEKAGRFLENWVSSLFESFENTNQRQQEKKILELLEELDNHSQNNVKVVRITDSKPFDRNRGIVVDCSRRIPLRFECIAPRAESEFEITLEKPWTELAYLINMYSYNMLYHSINIIEGQKNKDIEFLKKLDPIEGSLDRLTENRKSDIAYLRLGFGKGFYFNSVAFAIYKWVEENDRMSNKFKQYLLKEYPKLKDLDTFPSTYLKTDTTHEPLGWIRLERIK